MPVKIFFCYAHEDEAQLNTLKTHLKPLQQEGLIDVWYDRDINAGTEWEREISEQLKTAQIILLLVSPNFMGSDYCYGIEMKQAIERHKRGEARVIPIILRSVHWQLAPFGKLQALPKDAKPVKNWRDPDKAFVDVVTGIFSAIEQLTMRSPETAEITLVTPSKAPEVPLIKTTDSLPTPTLPQLSAISTSTPSSPIVSEGKQIFLASEEEEPPPPDWDDLPPLTLEQVKSGWENVMKRVKQRKQSATTAAMLRFYTAVGVEGTAEQPIIVIRAQKQGYYTYVSEQDRSKDVEWALTIEFGRQCKICLLPPPLTVQQVKEAWENVMKRVKQRRQGATTAAMLKFYNIVGVEGIAEQVVISI